MLQPEQSTITLPRLSSATTQFAEVSLKRLAQTTHTRCAREMAGEAQSIIRLGGCFLLHPGANAQTHSLNFEGGGCFLKIWFFLFDEIKIKSYRGQAWNAEPNGKTALQLITK